LSRSAKAGNRVLGARGDWVAPGKAWDRVSDTQIFGKRDFSLDLAFTRAHTMNIRGKGLAVLDSVAFVGVLVTARRIQNGSLHNDGVPTAEEVTVESISGGVTSGKNERLNTLAVRVLINGVEGFHEEIWYTHGVGGRAVPVVGHLNREGHMIAVVGRIEIHSVPALGEMKLEAKSVLAELRGSGQVGSFGVRLLSQTGIADCTVGDQRSIVRPASQISRSHSKTWRESFPSRIRLVSTSRAEKIVYGQPTIGHQRVGTIGPAVIQIGMPVHRVIHFLNGTGGTGRSEKLLVDIYVGRSLLERVETIGATDSVYVIPDNTGLNEGVNSSSEERLPLAKDLEERGERRSPVNVGWR